MRVVMTMRSQSRVPGGSGVPGGQIGMIQIARALGRLGVEIDLFVGGPQMAYLSGITDLTPTYFRWPDRLDQLMRRGPRFLRAPAARLRRWRWLGAMESLPGIGSADVIHVQGLQDAESVLTRVPGPIVVTHWGRTRRWQPRGVNLRDDLRLGRRLQHLRDNAVLVAIGDEQAGDMRAGGLPPAAVIPPGIDVDHFVPGEKGMARKQLGLGAEDRIVLYVGRLSDDKNVESLLRGFAGLPQQSRPTRLLVVGDGPLRTRLQDLTAALGIGAQTTFQRFVPHQGLPAYYQAADVTVVPSDKLETFCMVALEAIACACPLVVTDQVPEIIRNFPAVRVAPPYDLDGLRRQINGALDDGQPAADPAQAADFNWDAVARRYLDLYAAARRSP